MRPKIFTSLHLCADSNTEPESRIDDGTVYVTIENPTSRFTLSGKKDDLIVLIEKMLGEVEKWQS